MKKNISINISGIIFHIEEDGYDRLKDYLESINRYFSAFEDSHEIIADIESRIAEIFLSKLKEGKQVITIDDVDILIATMGSIKDFQAAEEDSAYISRMDVPEKEEEKEEKEGPKEAPVFSRRLYRDNKRKLLGGVLAGLGYYFSIDPIWTRLFYLLLFFGVSVLPSSAGILFLAYIVLWIVVPGSDELIEEKKIKKMYRDPDSKVLGGVAGGIAAYFGIDVVIVRLLFIAGIFAAFIGPIVYVILWIILPEAKTLTDKMEMQGQPVTLSNIESAIKKSLNVEGHEETAIVKILLFPFRLLAAVIAFLSKALGPVLGFLAEAARIVFAIVLILLGFIVVLAVLIALGTIIGLFPTSDLVQFYNIPFDVLKRDIGFLPALSLFVTLIIPFLFLALLGFRILMQRAVISSKIAWSAFAIWLLGIAVLSMTVLPLFRDFSRDGRSTHELEVKPSENSILLRYAHLGNDELDAITMNISPHEASMIRIEQTFSARGSDREKAIANAGMVEYELSVSDTAINFPSVLAFKNDARYRRQELRIELLMPYGQQFRMEAGMRNLLGNYLSRNGYSNNLLAGHTWYYDDTGLQCLDCPDQEDDYGQDSGEEMSEAITTFPEIEGYTREFDLSGFSEIEINSPLKVYVRQAAGHRVVLNGKREDINDIVVDKSGERLTVNYKKGLKVVNQKNRDVNVYIFMPEVHVLAFGGGSRSFVSSFTGSEIDVRLSGAAVSDMDLKAQLLRTELSGASRLNLNGSGKELISSLSGAASLYAFDYEVNSAEVNAASASNARITAYDFLKISSTGSSAVRYRGTARVEIEKKGGGSVRKED